MQNHLLELFPAPWFCFHFRAQAECQREAANRGLTFAVRQSCSPSVTFLHRHESCSVLFQPLLHLKEKEPKPKHQNLKESGPRAKAEGVAQNVFLFFLFFPAEREAAARTEHVPVGRISPRLCDYTWQSGECEDRNSLQTARGRVLAHARARAHARTHTYPS